VGLVTELPGRTEASRIAQVRARAAGILQQRLFREGSDVKAGQVLFRSTRPPTGQLATAQAAARARRSQPGAGHGAGRSLQAAGGGQRDQPAGLRQRRRRAEAGQAELAASRAALQTAQINLGYATVTAPISGRIGRSLVTEGALVGQGEATPAGGGAADRPDVRQLHAAGGGRAAPARGDRQRAAAPRGPASGPRAASCWTTAAPTRCRAGCCSAT
jgi:membrane fusion protein, multidrug efflux system